MAPSPGANCFSFILPIEAMASALFLTAGAEQPPDALTKVRAMCSSPAFVSAMART